MKMCAAALQLIEIVHESIETVTDIVVHEINEEAPATPDNELVESMTDTAVYEVIKPVPAIVVHEPQ